MNLRLSSLRAMFARPDAGRLAAAAAVALLLASAGLSSAMAAPADAASAPDAASVSYASGGQYTVRPGQSLNDAAIAVTQSHDRATLARAARALFDANPNAFMNHDPSRLRLGAVLTVPVLDASGAAASSAAAEASAAAAGGAAASSAASGAAQGNAAAAKAGSTPTQAAAPIQGMASAATDASSAATPSVVSSAPTAGSQAEAGASGTHGWTGSVQPSASAPVVGTAASQPRAQVSSLQQLLALKNRVLMELQKHGIGKSPAAPAAPAASGAQPAAGASSVVAAPGHPGAASSTANPTGISQTNLAVGVAVGAALVVLLGALRFGRRKREREAEAQAASSEEVTARAAEPADSLAAREDAAQRDPGDADNTATQHAAAMAAAEREAAEGEAAAREMSERIAAEREAEIRAAATREAEARDEAAAPTPGQAAGRHAAEEAESERLTAAQSAADAGAAAAISGEKNAVEEAAARQATSESEDSAAERSSTAHQTAAHEAPDLDLVTPQHVSHEQTKPASEAHHENLDGATTAASLSAAAELGADALPRAPLGPLDETWEHEPASHRLEWDDEALPDEPMEPSLPLAAASTEFPREALESFGSLDMPLPRRVESAADTIHAPESLSSQPVASPETTARQAFPPPPDADAAPHAADEIAAGTAGRGAVAGLGAGNLGAAGFGALKLDFDLELPPGPTQPLPAFTPADLARIARNKLDLAAEYIDLGDLAGARTLINEVIEANDPATRNDARALLSTLAPLS